MSINTQYTTKQIEQENYTKQGHDQWTLEPVEKMAKSEVEKIWAWPWGESCFEDRN